MIIHSDRSIKSLGLTYEIHHDKLRLGAMWPFKAYDIPFKDISELRIAKHSVIFDAILNNGFAKKYGYGMRIIKNDLCDIFPHVVVSKNDGFWRQVHFTPKDPDKFVKRVKQAMSKK